MLRLEGACLDYGGFRALDHVALHAEEGELVVLLGANGAGKSSIFHAISGLNRLAAGDIVYRGETIAGRKPSRIVADGIVHCPEGRKLFPGMSVRQNLELGAYVHRRERAARAHGLEEVFDLFPILRDKQHDPAGSLSGGQQQMVAIGRALMGRPKLLMLDEPEPRPRTARREADVRDHRRDQRARHTVLLAEQNAFAALRIASRAYVIESGRIVLEGTPASLSEDDRVRRAYLGG